MNKQALFAGGTILGGLALCVGVVVLQGGALVGGPSISVTSAIPAVQLAADLGAIEDEVEVIAVEDLPMEVAERSVREIGGVRSPARVKATVVCSRHVGTANVTVCDSQPRSVISTAEYHRSGGIIGDYREDFLEALED